MATTEATSLGATLRLAKALALSRRGKMADAQALLCAGRTVPETAIELHALAALVTSQGDYLRALKLWEMLLQRDPTQTEARRMIDVIQLWLSRPSWYRYLPYLFGVVVILAVLGLIFALGTSPKISPEKIHNLPAGINAPMIGPAPAVNYSPSPTPPATPPAISFPEAKPVRKKSPASR